MPRAWRLPHLPFALGVSALVVSALLLLPCLLPARIQAGDLSSHLYNAWLARLISAGEAPGLFLAPQHTNVLFDLLTSAAWRSFGPAAAERLPVCLAVLVFFWGAFALASVLARRLPLAFVPPLAMLSYGWFFHAGFFNFYLSAGLSFWILALLLRPSPLRLLAALALTPLAAAGHFLPPAIALSLAAYSFVAARLPLRRRPLLLASCVLLLLLLGRALAAALSTLWHPSQLALFTGTDQIVAFGSKYLLLQLSLLLLWIGLLVRAIRFRGPSRVLFDTRLHLILLSASAAVLLPGSILFPGYQQGLLFIAERMSLWVAVFLCGFLSIAPLKPSESRFLALLAVLHFSFLAYDVSALNRFEDRLSQSLSSLPPGARVVSAVTGASPAINPLSHIIDRACIGRCFSFANYEPSTAAFRVRSTPGNSFVIHHYPDSFSLQAGGYVVKPSDPPLYGIFLHSSTLSPRLLQPGETLRVTTLPIPPDFF